MSTTAVSPQVRHIAELIWQLTKEDQAQLWRLVLTPERPGPAPPLEAKAAIESFRRRLIDLHGGSPPSLDDQFMDGMTYREYFALSSEDEEAFWERLFAEHELDIDEIEEIDVPLVLIPQEALARLS